MMRGQCARSASGQKYALSASPTQVWNAPLNLVQLRGDLLGFETLLRHIRRAGYGKSFEAGHLGRPSFSKIGSV
jgi:hypothetical protein